MADERGRVENNLRKFREEQMLCKAEVARLAGISVLTVDRIERGLPSRPGTRKKILGAFGLEPSDRKRVFPNDP